MFVIITRLRGLDGTVSLRIVVKVDAFSTSFVDSLEAGERLSEGHTARDDMLAEATSVRDCEHAARIHN